ncbi:Fis family transcriptional regulator [Nostoc sp. CENA543]|nr:Fis family transcriptional regulator [Nostoc sp. CENA543]
MFCQKKYLTYLSYIMAICLPLTINLPKPLEMLQVLAQTPNSRKEAAEKLLQQGREQYQASQFDAALQSWQQALVIYQEIRDYENEVKVLNNIGLAYQVKGEYDSAINYLERSLGIAKKINYRLGAARALGNLGIIYQDKGDYGQAIDYHQQNLAIAVELKDNQSQAKAVANIGLVYYFLGDVPTAIKQYSQALAIFRNLADRQSEATLLNNLGLAYSAIGNYSNAIQNYQQALMIIQAIKNPQLEGKILGNLGSIYYFLGKYPQAIDYQQKWLTIARAIVDPRSEGDALGNLGLTYSVQGNYPQAINYQQQSLAIARKISDQLGEGQSLNNLGLTFFKSGNLSAAETNLYAAINIWENLRSPKSKLQNTDKVSLFDTQKNTYALLQQVLVAQNKPDAALEISERGRARAFVELLASRSFNNNKNVVNPARSLTIEEMKQIAKTQNSTLVQYSIIREEFQVSGKLQFQESELYIWVIKPTGEITFRKADLKPLWQKENTNLEKLVSMSRQSIGVRGRGGLSVSPKPDAPKTKQRLSRLHQLLIQPIADVLPKQDSEKVIFIPQNELFLVPFPALQDEQGKYLIQKHTILTAPAIQVLDFTRQQKLGVGNGDVLIVGNPTMPKVILEPGKPSEKLTSLPWAEKEAREIAAKFNTQALIGNKATKTTIVNKMTQARIIHFATHGLLDDNRGLGSAIALAPSSTDNGLLTAEEILNLKLNADLVVLSACDTGRGRITGDGVIGLSRSLISAGTPSVIVSLWAVDDNSTSFLMTEFYKNIQQQDKATALRQAMLTTMQKYPQPINWAAFTLIGESK